MPNVLGIVTFLEGEQLLAAPPVWKDGRDRESVLGIAGDARAGKGEMAWLSPKYATAERLAAFHGALLLGPAELPHAPSPQGVVVACRNPKWAFTRAVNEFFPELLQTPWPGLAENPVDASARIAEGVRLGHGAVIGPGTEIGAGSVIGPNTCIAHTTIGRNVRIGANCSIGLSGFGYEKGPDGRYQRFPHVGGVVIEDEVEIGSNTCVDRGGLGDTRIRRGAKVDNLVHVAHNVDIGENALVIAHAMLGGSVVLGAGSWIAPSAAIMNQADVGAGAVVGLGAVVLKNVAAGATVVGNPAKPLEKKTPS